MQTLPMERTQAQLGVNEFIRSVYNWMAIGLSLTGFVAYYVSNSESLLRLIFGNRLIFFGLIAAFLISCKFNQLFIKAIYIVFH